MQFVASRATDDNKKLRFLLFLSMLVDIINVFDCCLLGVILI